MSITSILSKAGIPHKNHNKPGHSGSFNPVGVINHHTAGSASGVTPSLGVVLNGRTGLPGPLCQIYIGRDASVHVITEGKAYHAGLGSQAVLNAVRAGTPPPSTGADAVNGNPLFYGIEVENTGLGEPYPAAVIDVLVRVNQALIRHHGWNANHCIHHREWTRRKTDMSYRGDLRGMIAAAAPTPQPTGPISTTTQQGANKVRVDLKITTDGNGNGWGKIDRPYSTFRSATAHGSYPPVDDYWKLPRIGAQDRDGTLISVTEGPPNSTITVLVAFEG